MVKEVLQAGLEVEMTEHLGYERYSSEGREQPNSRNGGYAKTVTTDVGPVELRMSRDRDGSFEPVTVPKHVRRLEGLGANVISLYAKGLTHQCSAGQARYASQDPLRRPNPRLT